MRRSAARPEQLAYAAILDIGVGIGIATLVVTFALYLAGVPAPYVDVDRWPEYWGLSVDEYRARTGFSGGWSWLWYLNHGDILNFIGIAVLSGVTFVCYIPILRIFLQRRETVYIVICVLEMLVIAIAASGLLDAGVH